MSHRIHNQYRIRIARPDDAGQLLAIYRRYIDTGVTFEYHLPSEEAFGERIRDTLRRYPYLVLEVDGHIMGYAYAHRFRDREAYQWCAELSVYLSPDAKGQGLGALLYVRLMALLRLQHVYLAYALVTGANEGSLRFHERLGFRSLGRHEKAGYKGGQWLDMYWYDLPLLPQEGAPRPFIPFPRLSLRALRRAMTRPLS